MSRREPNMSQRVSRMGPLMSIMGPITSVGRTSRKSLMARVLACFRNRSAIADEAGSSAAGSYTTAMGSCRTSMMKGHGICRRGTGQTAALVKPTDWWSVAACIFISQNVFIGQF